MIKIIKDGTEKVYMTRCVKCGTDFSYQTEDIHREKPAEDWDAFMRQKAPLVYVLCPICGERTVAGMLEKDDENPWLRAMMTVSGLCVPTFGPSPKPPKGEDHENADL